ncbi:hypothetical protein ACLOJK_027932 [Asimina triloba]
MSEWLLAMPTQPMNALKLSKGTNQRLINCAFGANIGRHYLSCIVMRRTNLHPMFDEMSNGNYFVNEGVSSVFSRILVAVLTVLERGTAYVYDSFLRPYVAKHETEIDRNLMELRTRAGDMAVLYWQKAASYGQTRVFEILQYVASQSQRPRPAQVGDCQIAINWLVVYV